MKFQAIRLLNLCNRSPGSIQLQSVNIEGLCCAPQESLLSKTTECYTTYNSSDNFVNTHIHYIVLTSTTSNDCCMTSTTHFQCLGFWMSWTLKPCGFPSDLHPFMKIHWNNFKCIPCRSNSIAPHYFKSIISTEINSDNPATPPYVFRTHVIQEVHYSSDAIVWRKD